MHVTSKRESIYIIEQRLIINLIKHYRVVSFKSINYVFFSRYKQNVPDTL